jgi:cell division septation protein DedD
MRLFPCAVVFVALCAASAQGLGLDPALREARLDLMAADREGAASMYAAWLDANPGSPAAPIVFNRYFDTEQNLSALLEHGARFLRTARTGASLSEAFARIARLFEVAGMAEQARDVYLSAYAQGAPVSALESAFLLSLEMNDVQAMQSALADLKDDVSDRAELLKACAAFQKGDNGPAVEILTRITDTGSDQSAILKALWLRYRIAVQSGDPAARQAAVKLLQARFPRSPEYELAAPGDVGAAPAISGNVTLLAMPGSFLGGQPAPSPELRPPVQDSTGLAPEPAASDAGRTSSNPEQATHKTLSVQAGSFQMKENADDLISELAKSGFAPTLRTDAAQGKLLYRVFVGRGLSAEEAQALLDRLHGTGFSGFLMNDQ